MIEETMIVVGASLLLTTAIMIVYGPIVWIGLKLVL
mgnify:CR=1 FL=1|jgi:hypothetical protein